MASASASASARAFIPPQGMQQLPEGPALQHLREQLSTDFPALLSAIDHDANATSLEHALDRFAPPIACKYLSGDLILTRRVLRLARALTGDLTFFWGALRQLFSPIVRSNPLIAAPNPVHPIDVVKQLLDNQQPRDALLAGFDYVTCPPERSILSPAAYLVDLLRLVGSGSNVHPVDPTGFGESEDAAIGATPIVGKWLRYRRPDIYDLLLSPENTFDTVPYLDIVNDALANVIVQETNRHRPPRDKLTDAFQVLAERTYPLALPYNRPLHQLRATMNEIGVPIERVIRTTRQRSVAAGLLPAPDGAPPQRRSKHELREILGLSKEDWHVIVTERSAPKDIMQMYGVKLGGTAEILGTAKAFLKGIADVNRFLARTGLTRDQLQDLVYQDLSAAEFAVGQSRVFFVNDVDDGKSHLEITQEGDEFNSDGKGVTENIENLSWKKLDRLHRFARLAMRLKWSYIDLDWALRAIKLSLTGSVSAVPTPESVASRSLLFDGLNDFIAVELQPEDGDGFFEPDELTIEGWVMPVNKERTDEKEALEMLFALWNPEVGSTNTAGSAEQAFLPAPPKYSASWIVGLNSALQVAVGNWNGRKGSFMTDARLTPGQYSHLCVKVLRRPEGNAIDTETDNTVPENTETDKTEPDTPMIQVFINGKEQSGSGMPSKIELPHPPVFGDKRDSAASSVLAFGQYFEGHIKDVRVWDTLRDKDVVKQSMFQKLTGFEKNLLGYWPLAESVLGKVLDYSKYTHSGTLGYKDAFSVPRWKSARLFLDFPRELLGLKFTAPVDIEQSLTVNLRNLRPSPIDLSLSSELMVVSFWVVKHGDGLQSSIFSLQLNDAQSGGQSDVNWTLQLWLDGQDRDMLTMSLFKDGESAKDAQFRHTSDVSLKANDLHFVALYLGQQKCGFSIRPGSSWSGIPVQGLSKPQLVSLKIGQDFRGVLHDMKVWKLDEEESPLQGFNPLQPGEESLIAHWPMFQGLVEYDDQGNMTVADVAHWPMLQEQGGMDLIGRKQSDFSPTKASANNLEYKRLIALRESGNPGTSLVMDSKTAVEISTGKNFGVGRMKEGTIGFWFKCAKVSPNKDQLLYSHGDDDLGITIYIEKNRNLIVLPWFREYDAKKGEFLVSKRYSLGSSDGVSPNLQAEQWYHMALSFAREKTVDIQSFSLQLFIDGVGIGKAGSIPITPTGNMILGGIPKDSPGWIVFKSSEGRRTALRPDTFFSGALLDFNVWSKALDGQSLQPLVKPSAEDRTVPLLWNIPLYEMVDDQGNGPSNLTVNLFGGQEENCFPEEVFAKLFREKKVLITTGETPYASSYSFCQSPATEKWKDYSVRGRFHCTAESSGVGVIIHSSAKLSDEGMSYRDGIALFGEVHGENIHFRLSRLPTLVSNAQANVALSPQDAIVSNKRWISFEITSKYVSDELQVAAKLWLQGDVESKTPTLSNTFSGFQSGQIGVWGFGEGRKMFDDLIAFNEGAEEELLFAGFEEFEEGRIAWKDLRSDLLPFDPVEVAFPPPCFGWNTLYQPGRRVAVFGTEKTNLLQEWSQSNTRTSISGRLMFENDGGGVGVYFGTRRDSRYLCGLVRAPYDTEGRGAASDLVDAYKFRLEIKGYDRLRERWIEFPDILPVHSRWYQFRVEFFSEPNVTEVSAKVWEFGTEEPDQFLVEPIAQRLGRNEYLGVMGSGTGNKYFSDVSTSQVEDGDLTVRNVDNPFDVASWTGRTNPLVGFGPVQATQSIVGKMASGREVGAQSLYCPPIGNDSARWEECVRLKNYTVSGRVYRATPADSFGFTLYNRVPVQENLYYIIASLPQVPKLRVAFGYGDRVYSDVLMDAAAENVTSDAGWYRFRLTVQSRSETTVRGKFWKQEFREPDEDTLHFVDRSPLRLESGTFGVWSNSNSCLFQELKLGKDLNTNDVISGISSWDQFVVESYSVGRLVRRRLKLNEPRFSVRQENGKGVITASPIDSEMTYAVSSVPVSSGITVAGDVQVVSAGAVAGFLFFGDTPHSEKLGVFVRTNAQGGKGSMFLSRFIPESSRNVLETERFLTLGASTQRTRAAFDIEAGDSFKAIIEIRLIQSAENETLVRVRAKFWSTGLSEPSHFPLVGYTSVPSGSHGFGFYGGGVGDKLFSSLSIVHEEDMLPNGNEVGQAVGWVNSQWLSMDEFASTSDIFLPEVRADKSLQYLQKDSATPSLEQLQLLDFSGGTPFLSAFLGPLRSWTFRTSFLSRGKKGPIMNAPEFRVRLDVITKESPSSLMLVLDHEQGPPAEFPLSDEELIDIEFSVIEGETGEKLHLMVRSQVGDKVWSVTRGSLSVVTQSSELFVGRNFDKGTNRFVYFDGLMYDIMLLKDGQYLNGPTYLPHKALAGREAARNNLIASWPAADGKEFVFGGLARPWNPSLVSKQFPKPFQRQDRAFFSDQAVILFPGDLSSKGGLLVQTFDPSPSSPEDSTKDVRQRSIDIVFKAFDVVGKYMEPQKLFEEGQLGLYISSGMLHYVVGDRSFAAEVFSNEWYSATLVWDAGRELRPGALVCYLNGFPIAVNEGQLIQEQSGVTSTLGSSTFAGCIQSLKVFYNALIAADVLDLRKSPDSVPQDAQLALSVNAQNIKSLTESISWSRSSVSIVPASSTFFGHNKTYSFEQGLETLAFVQELAQRGQLGIVDATAVFGPLKDYGVERGSTSQFDRLFNKNVTGESALEWSLGMRPLPWSLQGDSTSDWVVRARLRNAVAVPPTEFEALLELSKPERRVDGSFLTRLVNAARLGKLTGVDFAYLEQFMTLMKPGFDSFGAEDVVLLLDSLDWMQKAGFDAESALYHLGKADLPVVTGIDISSLSALMLGDKDGFSIVKESFSKNDLTEGESAMLVFALKKRLRSGLEPVLDEDGLVVAEYFSQHAYNELHANEDWIMTLKRGLFDLLMQEYNSLLSLRRLVDAEMEFGKRGILLEALQDSGYIFGASMHRQFSWEDLRKELAKSTTVGLKDTSSSETDEILRLLADAVLPKWAAKARNIEDVLFEHRDVMEQSLFQALGTVFSLERASVEAVINGGCGGPVSSLVKALLSAPPEEQVTSGAISGIQDVSSTPPVEAYADLKTCVKIAQLAEDLEMSVLEIQELVDNPGVFGVQPELNRLDLFSLAALAEYRRVREYIAARRLDLLGVEVDATVKDLVVLFQSANLKGLTADSVSSLFSWSKTDTEWIVTKIGVRRGTTVGVQKRDLWQLCNIHETATELAANVQSLWNVADADTFAEYKQLAIASTQSLQSKNEDRFERTQKKIVDSVLQSSRDALLGLTVSIVTPDGKEYENAAIAVGEYLLLDIETEPAVLASRVQQAIQSIQLYIHRTLLGLERDDILEAGIGYVRAQWNSWLQNYRVWEAARRVYLYPENFVEPELRSDSTPEFVDLVRTVSGATDERAISGALLSFIESVGKVLSNLRIAGAGFSTSVETVATVRTGKEETTEHLILVGKTTSSPAETYVRRRSRTPNETKWFAWEKVDQPITADWISPAYAFGKLHLFWISWQEQRVPQVYVFKEKTWNLLKVAQDTKSEKENFDPENAGDEYNFTKAMIELGERNKRISDQKRTVFLIEKDVLDDMYQDSDKTSWDAKTLPDNEVRTAPLFQPEIHYISKKLNESWTSPQVYNIPKSSLFGDMLLSSSESIPGGHRVPALQRLYCARAELKQDDPISEEAKAREVNVKNPFVLLASNSVRAEPLTSTRPIDKAMTFDFLSRISQNTTHSYTVYKKNFPSETDTFSLNRLEDIVEDTLFFDEPKLPAGIRILRGGAVFDFDLVMRRKKDWQQVTEKLDEGLRTWLQQNKGSFGSDSSAVKKLLKPIREQMRKVQEENGYSDSEVERRFGIGWLAFDSKDDFSVEKMDLYLLSLSLKKSEQYDLGFLFKPVTDSELTFNAAFIPLSSDPLDKWFHFALEIDLFTPASTIRLKSRALGEVGKVTEVSKVLDWKSPGSRPARVIGSSFEVGRSLHLNDEQGSHRLPVRCELSEARIWKASLPAQSSDDDAMPTFENVFTVKREGYRLSPNSSSLVGVAALRETFEKFSNVGSQQFVRAKELTLKVVTSPPQEFDAERILIFIQSRVFSVQNGSKQAFDVTLEQDDDFDCLQLEMSRDSFVENSTASIRATIRSKPPQFSQSSEDVDFFSGSSDYGINADKLEELQAGRGEPVSVSAPLLGNLLWKSSTLQPVQNLFGVSILQTGDGIFLLEAHSEENVSLRRVLSNYITLDKVEGALRFSLVPPSDDVPTLFGVRYKLERLSSSASARFEERLAKGGVDALLSLDVQLGAEAEVMFRKIAEGKEPAYGQILIPENIGYVSGVVMKKTFSNSSSAIDKALSEAFNRIDFHGVNGIYFWELFMHAPLLIATNLNSGGEYARATQWLEFIFRPIRNEFKNETFSPWQFQPFVESAKNNSVDAILSILGDGDDAKNAVAAFRKNPFDAHNIAASRQTSYQLNIFQRYVSNLLDQADSLFIDDRESINKALLYYRQAAKVLGRRPREIPRSRNVENTSPRTIEALRQGKILMKNFVVPYVKNAPALDEENSPELDVENASKRSTSALDAVSLMVSFCVPENDILLQLWTRLEDRLYKVRNSLNIEGIFRQVDLFAPPIDPSALVGAVAGGANALQAAANVRRGVPHYRFDYMLQSAIEAAEAATAMAEDMLSAMESRDAEAIAIIEADQARTLNQFMVDVSRKQMHAAGHEVRALQAATGRIEMRMTKLSEFLENGEQFEGQYDAGSLGIISSSLSVAEFPRRGLAHYTEVKNKKRDGELTAALDLQVETDEGKKRKIVEDDLAAYKKHQKDLKERKRIAKKADKARKKAKSREQGKASANVGKKVAVASGESATRGSAGVVSAFPNTQSGVAGLGPLVSVSFGGEQLARGLEIAADVISLTTTIIDLVQEVQAQEAQKEADRLEWTTELQTARVELTETTAMLRAAHENAAAAEIALDLSVQEGIAAGVIHAAHSQKFTNLELYNWLSGELRRMYRRIYNVAVEMARSAERGLQFELPTDKTFISGSGWRDARNGLLASKMLQAELRQMANYRVEQDSRFLEIERKISLRRDFKKQFQELIEDEECELDFSEVLFDRDFPGHYFRVLKTVSVSMIPSGNGRIEEQFSLCATLTQTSNRVVMTPDFGTVQYLWDKAGDVPNNTLLRSNWRSNQTIALSKWRDDTGMFHLSYDFDDRYFSFEGTGAVSTWQLKIPAKSNPGLTTTVTASSPDVVLPALEFDQDSNVDIVIKLLYSAKADFGSFQGQVASELPPGEGLS